MECHISTFITKIFEENNNAFYTSQAELTVNTDINCFDFCGLVNSFKANKLPDRII